jgi:hypothetical protein
MRVRSLFLSDAHLGCRFSRADELFQFLGRVEPDQLYLVGDIIDGWKLKRSFYWNDTLGITNRERHRRLAIRPQPDMRRVLIDRAEHRPSDRPISSQADAAGEGHSSHETTQHRSWHPNILLDAHASLYQGLRRPVWSAAARNRGSPQHPSQPPAAEGTAQRAGPPWCSLTTRQSTTAVPLTATISMPLACPNTS